MYKVLAVLTAAVVLAGCGGGDGPSNPPGPPAVATVELSQQTATVRVGDVVTLSVVAKDASGQVLTGRTANWTSSNSAIASVSGGAVTGLGPGTVTITVNIEGKTAQATITVELPGVATIAVSPQRNFVQVGATLQLTALLRDANGSQINGRTVVWSSSDETKATVSQSGVVTGKAPGTVTITATSDGKTGTAPVTVTILPAPSISGITPATLTPGVTATITGTNFSTTPSENTVTVAGVAVTVTAATATELTVVLPAQMPCLPTGPVVVEVLTGGGFGTRSHPIQVAPQRTLAVGQALLLLDIVQTKCNELLGGSKYLVSVFNTSTVPSSRAPADVKGASSASTAALPPAFASLSPLFSLSGGGSDLAIPSARVKAARALVRGVQRDHLARLDADRALLRRLGSPRAQRARMRAARTMRAPGSAVEPSTVVVPTTVGATTTIKFPARGSCTSFTDVTAKVVYSGQHAVVLEDVKSPLAGQLDADYARFGQLFDNTLYPIEENFGDINAADADLDNPGTVLMLFTPLVNTEAPGLLGFVTLCDFFDPLDPRGGTTASNKTKIFYARAALRLTQQDPNRISFDERPLWALTIPSVLVHESKHITSFAERWFRDASMLEESWLEEATAQIASELYGRTVWTGATWRSNAEYGWTTPSKVTMYCEVRNLFAPGLDSRCNSYTYNVSDNYFNLYDYYQAIEEKSFLSSASADQTIYGSAWLFVRWLTDQYGGTNEKAFLRSLVQEKDDHGWHNVETKTGTNFSELLGYFTLSLIADDYPGFTPLVGAKYTIPSWNTRDMFAGMTRDFPTDFPTFPLRVHAVNFGTFDVPLSGIAGGSAGYLEIGGTPPPRQLLDLSSLDNASPIRLAILRVQ